MTVSAAVSSNPVKSTGADVSLQLRLLATTDLHAHLFSFNYYANRPDDGVGLARLAAPILQARSESANCLLLDNGDTFQGAPLGDAALSDLMPAAQPHPMIAAMNGLGFDAATLGNHDFDYGVDILERVIAGARYPFVLCNVTHVGGGPFVAPHAIIERGMIDSQGALRMIRVGITGAVPAQTMQWVRPQLSGRLAIAPILPSVTAEVAQMRAADVDLVVVLAHSGLGTAQASPDDENVAIALAQIDGVDAVIAGHTHRVFPCPTMPAPPPDAAPIVQPGFFGSHLGQIDLELRPRDAPASSGDGPLRWHVVKAAARLRRAQEADAGQRHALRRRLHHLPGFRAEMARGHRLTRAYSARPLGRSAVALETYFSLLQPCMTTQLIADAQRLAVAPIIAADPALAGLPLLSCTTPFKAGGRGGPDFYSDVPPGAFLLRHAADLYPYSNSLALLRATGAQIRAWLERAAAAFRQITPDGDPDAAPQLMLDQEFASYNFDRLDGLRYRIDLRRPARTNAEGDEIHTGPGRIRDLCREGGAPVADDDVFLVVTNSYRAAGGGHFPAAAQCETIYQSSHPVRDVIAGHVATMRGAVAPSIASGFGFSPMGGVPVIYETGPGAAAHPERLRQLGLVYQGLSDQGFARYLLRL